jgi:hypothetical protein
MVEIERRNFLSMLASLTALASLPNRLLAWNPTIQTMTMMRSSIQVGGNPMWDVGVPVSLRRDGRHLVVTMRLAIMEDSDRSAPSAATHYLVRDIERALGGSIDEQFGSLADITMEGFNPFTGLRDLDIQGLPCLLTRTAELVSVTLGLQDGKTGILYGLPIEDIRRALRG